MGIGSSLATSCGHGVMWERGELGVGVLTLSERSGWGGIQFVVILEFSGSCYLRKKKILLLLVLLL